MKRFAVLGFLLLFFYASPAQAGFEWMPPSQQPAQTPDIVQQYNTMSHDNGMNPMAMDNHMGGAPATPVMSEPLSPLAPTTIMPQRQPPQDGRLYINPYPLQDAFRTGEPSELTGSSVEKAMVEESRMLHPLHLGAGMKTGAQPVKAPGASVNEMANPYQTASLPMKSMTPMMGGEPASLPGAAMPRGPMQATPIGGFSEAVGFGRDLPLALALSQVIPSGFTHSYAEGVDPGATVSWEGGKPWNEVLNDMLAQQGLSAAIRGNQVTIQSGFQS